MPQAKTNPYELGLDKNAANFVPLSPIGFLSRSAAVYPDRPAVIYGARRYGWRQALERCRRLAAALAAHGIRRGDTVAVMAPNIPEMFEAHFGVPMAGAVLNALNIRLDPETIAFILRHGEAKVLITDTEFAPVVNEALARLERKPFVVDILDPAGPGGTQLGQVDYEAFLSGADPGFAEITPADEWDAIALNYTSGTTGNPKGVVYHHRGAYLNALGNILVWGLRQHPVYLWTLPMFHCNGWCFPWTITALAGTHVCLRRVEAAAIYETIARDGVSHLCGAPVVMNMLLNAGPEFDRLARPAGRDDDRRGLAAGRGDRGHGGDRLSHHPCLRPDRGLWARDRMRLAPRMGCAADRGALSAEGAPRGQLPGARRAEGRGPGEPRTGRGRRYGDG